MTRHQAVRQQFDRVSFQALRQNALERLVVARLVEQPHPPHATVENVENHASRSDSCGSRHVNRIWRLVYPVNN